ncbi:MAG TPA: Ku protein [Gaiellaceae bacterium]|jgi:DNA end-binding protein Ku|nr:Ku protein [Gaiellaceae bacterium]
MPRAIWSGSLSFGLVAVPVRMYSAIEEHTLHFNYVHEPDGSRIGYEKICKAEDKPVPEDEIVKAFEYEKGEWVYMSDQDFEAAAAENHRTIDIRSFVPYDEIDPIYFERTYYLAPQEDGQKVYALLVRAMEQSGLAAVAKWVMRDRQNLGLLRIRDSVITLERMHFADEIRSLEDIAPGKSDVSKQELDMAAQLIEQYKGEFKPEEYRDTYRDALCEIIEAKRRGEEVRAEVEPEPEAPTDLMAALRASVEAARRRRPAGVTADGELDDMSREELYELAKKADIPGRAQMKKDELIDALRRAA